MGTKRDLRQRGSAWLALLRVPRSRGALSGVVLVVLGAFGALIPFMGPIFVFAYTPEAAWVYTPARLWLEIVRRRCCGWWPDLALQRQPRLRRVRCLVSRAGGSVVHHWPDSEQAVDLGVSADGLSVGGTLRRTVEEIVFFTGLGVVIVFSAAVALGRLAVVAARDVELATAGSSVRRSRRGRDGLARSFPARPGQRMQHVRERRTAC